MTFTRYMCPILMLAAAAPARPVEYRLTPGNQFSYHTTSTTRYPKLTITRTEDCDLWVADRNPDQSLRLVVRQTAATERAQADGKKQSSEPQVSWGRCDFTVDGRTSSSCASGDLAWTDLFIPLPKDTNQARLGWDRKDTTYDERDVYRLDNKTVSDSVWRVLLRHETPLDDVYGITHHGLIELDMVQGWPVGRTEMTEQTFGGRKSQSETKLVRVGAFDRVAFQQFLPDLERFLAADSAASALINAADDNPEQALALLSRADTLLVLSLSEVRDSVLGQQLERFMLDNHERLLSQQKSESSTTDRGLKGKPAPDWKLQDLAGKTHTLKQYQGKVLLLDFWYRGCPWCIRAMPQLQALSRQFAGKPVQVLGMNIDRDTADARFVVDKLKLDYPQLLARGVPETYGVTGYPTLFVIDQQGRVSDIHIGYSRDIGARLAARVNALLESK